LNVNGFWDALAALVGHMVEQGFVRPAHAALLLRDADPQALVRLLREGEARAGSRRDTP
jgi:predicted Rossmann-fold nucleotide-binding protein